MNKKALIIGGVVLGFGILTYVFYKILSRPTPGAGKKGGKGGPLIGKVVSIKPFGTAGTSGEQDYDGTIYDALFHENPDRNSRIYSKVPQGETTKYDVIDQNDDWVYLFSIDSVEIYDGWAPVESVTTT